MHVAVDASKMQHLDYESKLREKNKLLRQFWRDTWRGFVSGLFRRDYSVKTQFSRLSLLFVEKRDGRSSIF
jgi:hypothetical protein